MKGYSTQAAILLTTGPVSLDDIAKTMREFGEVKSGSTGQHWAFADEWLSIPLKSHPRGRLVVDYVPFPWPDQMGDDIDSADVVAAWKAGRFGPFTFVDGLARALEQCWLWPEGLEEAPEHDGFIRLLTTYASFPEDTHVPPSVDVKAEITQLTSVAERLSKLPEVICYFNPNGETLLTPKMLSNALARNRKNRLPDLDVWTNIRILDMSERAAEWFVADTCGMWQVDAPDHEAAYLRDKYDADEVAEFLRNISLYVLRNPGAISNGDTTDGPGGVDWQVYKAEQSLSSPPRATLRWFPFDKSQRPGSMMQYVASRT